MLPLGGRPNGVRPHAAGRWNGARQAFGLPSSADGVSRGPRGYRQVARVQRPRGGFSDLKAEGGVVWGAGPFRASLALEAHPAPPVPIFSTPPPIPCQTMQF